MSAQFSEADAHRLAAIVESSDDAILSKDLNGIVQTWNRAAERMFGYTAGEIVGRSITTIIPADRLAEEDAVIARIRRGEPVEPFETMRRRKDGSLIPISLTASPIRNHEGRVIGASKIARDITERRRIEAALATAEARQMDLQQRLVALVGASGTLFGSRNFGDMMPAVIALARTLIRADGYALWRMDAATQSWQIGASAGISDEFSQAVTSNNGTPISAAASFDDVLVAESVRDMPMPQNRLAAFEAEGIESMVAVPVIIDDRASGAIAFYYRSRQAFSDVEVHTAKALATVAAAAISTAELYDEQRRSREQAELAKRQAAFLADASAALSSSLDYESTLRSVADLAVPHIADWCAVDVVDEQGNVRRLAVAHVDPAKVELAHAFQKWYPDSPGSVAHIIRTGTAVLVREITDEMLAAAAKSREHLEAMRQLAIRSYICVPMVAHGRTVGAITFVAAESGRRYSDADLGFAHDVAYRAALAVENARAYRQLNAANRAKDEFLATLSHELRTPLNAVLGWTRMLRSGTVSPQKMERAFEVIERNATAQLNLVEDLLDLSRIITGKFRLDVLPVEVSAAIDAAVEAVLPAATAKEIAVEVHSDEGRHVVLGDASRLQQAIWNLLSNAIKFTPRGGRMDVRVAHNEGQVEIAVADTGEGIEPSVLPFVFDRFRQGESGTTRTHMGLGLGLAIVRHIVELHGGSVAVTSAGKGHGATFTMSIPAQRADRAAIVFNREPSRWHDGVLDGLRALVVDDDRDARELLGDLLRSRGVVVTTASSADEGLSAIDRDVPDVILTDIAMPGRDGLEFIRVVRERPEDRGGRVPAIALTAYARAEDSARSLSSGFQVHLSKPVDINSLFSAVAAVSGRADGSDSR